MFILHASRAMFFTRFKNARLISTGLCLFPYPSFLRRHTGVFCPRAFHRHAYMRVPNARTRGKARTDFVLKYVSIIILFFFQKLKRQHHRGSLTALCVRFLAAAAAEFTPSHFHGSRSHPLDNTDCTAVIHKKSNRFCLHKIRAEALRG